MSKANMYKSGFVTSEGDIVDKFINVIDKVVDKNPSSPCVHGLIITYMNSGMLRVVYTSLHGEVSYIMNYMTELNNEHIDTIVNLQHYNVKHVSYISMEEYAENMGLTKLYRTSYRGIQIIACDEIRNRLER